MSITFNEAASARAAIGPYLEGRKISYRGLGVTKVGGHFAVKVDLWFDESIMGPAKFNDVPLLFVHRGRILSPSRGVS